LRHFLYSRLFVTVCLVLAIFISLGVNWLIARSIVRRLRIIQIAAERIAFGNLHVRIAMTEPDEIGRLGRAFNRMTENLQDTLNNLADEQIRERQAQLEALQAQLAPHFLFNCLTALGGLIINNKEKALVFLEKLSYTYRYVLTHRQQHLVTLEEELNFVNAYTFLASIRFQDGFNVETTVSNEYFQHKLPSMALQLLLENAVKHNVVSTEQPLRISLEIVCLPHSTSLQAIPYLIVRNNIQPRTMSINSFAMLSAPPVQPSVSDSMHLGLQNLQNRYKLLTNHVPDIEEQQEEFIVRLPLIVCFPTPLSQPLNAKNTM
jgi:sensor histidine kinase YesM